MSILQTVDVVCQDCNGAGDDLCDICDGSGRRSGGKCRACWPFGSGTVKCPTCKAAGHVPIEEAESMGWLDDFLRERGIDRDPYRSP